MPSISPSRSASQALGQNQSLSLTANTPAGGISRLIRLAMTTTYDRPWLSWLDENARHRAAAGYHTTDVVSGAVHAAFEIKTSADPNGSAPGDMRTRFSVPTDVQRGTVGFNYCDTLEVNQAENPIALGESVTPFGLKMRGRASDQATAGNLAQFTVQVDASDNPAGFIDVMPFVAGTSKSVSLSLFRNTNTSSSSNPTFAIKRGDGTNTNAFLFSPKLGTLGVTPNGAVSASTSAGGALNITNTSSTGAGLVVYSDQGATANGRLAVFNVDNVAFPTQVVYIRNDGASHALAIDHNSTGSNALGLTITSINPNDTAFGVEGQESGRGTIKVTHKKPDGVADTNASAISINLDRVNAAETSAAQGIFMDSTHAMTSNLLNLRNNGSGVLTLTSSLLTVVPNARFNGQIGFNNTAPIAKPTVSGSRGGNAALASLLTALANYGLVTDSSSA